MAGSTVVAKGFPKLVLGNGRWTLSVEANLVRIMTMGS